VGSYQMAIKILYVEDNQAEIEQVLPLLRKSALGFMVELAENTRRAEELLAQPGSSLPDLILSDASLSDGSGLGLLTEIRKLELPVAVVLIAEQGSEEAAVAALKAGADDYLTSKPELLDQIPLLLIRALDHFNESKTLNALPIKVLYIEHNPAEFDLARRHINLYAPNILLEEAASEEEALLRLTSTEPAPDYDIVLLDLYPAEDHPLQFVEAWKENLAAVPPLIVITGQGSEEIAVEALQLGVSDYLVKHAGYLFRLPSVLENVHHLKELEKERTALRLSEERFRRLADNAQDIIFRLRIEPEPAFEYISPAVKQLLGIDPEDLYRDLTLLFSHTEIQQSDFERFIERRFREEDTNPVLAVTNTQGQHLWLDIRTNLVKDELQGTTTFEGIARDITQHLMQDEKIQTNIKKLKGLHLIDSAISSNFDLHLTYRLFIDQSVALLEVDAADILLFEPDLSTPRIFITSGLSNSDEVATTVIQNFVLVDRDILDKKIVHTTLDQIKEKSSALYEMMVSQNLTEYWAAPLVVKGQLKGVFEVFQKGDQPRDPDWIDFLGMLAQQASIALDNSRNFEKLQRSNQDLIRAYDETLTGWINLLDLRDKDTEGHTIRVLDIMIKVAEAFGFQGEEMAHLRRGVILHDIGKIAIPDRILNKPGPLTEEEWEIMRKHPRLAYDMLMPIDYLRPSLDIPYCHHEKWDGSGYPQGLKGTEIPLSARIFAVIDTFDALISYRAYRDPMSVSDALEYIVSQSGIQFDPEVVERCLPLLKTYRALE